MPERQLRAPLRAQLLDEGFSVRAIPSREIALAYLVRTGEKPRMTILQTLGLSIETRPLWGLRHLTGQALFSFGGSE